MGANVSRASRSRGSFVGSCAPFCFNISISSHCLLPSQLLARLQVFDAAAASRIDSQNCILHLLSLPPTFVDLRMLDTKLVRVMNIWFGLVSVLVEVLMVRLPVEVCSIAAWMSEAVVAATWSTLAFATQWSAPPASTISALVAPPHLAPSSG